MPSYVSLKTTKLLFTVQQLRIFQKNRGKNFFWVTETINDASATNSIMSLSHTLYVIADAKALCSILHSSGNIQIKSCWGPLGPPQLH